MTGPVATRLRELLQPFGDPELDEQLPGDAVHAGLPVESGDDPGREIHIDPPCPQIVLTRYAPAQST